MGRHRIAERRLCPPRCLLAATVIATIAAGTVARANDPLLEASRWRFFSDPAEVSSLYINDLIQEIGGKVWLASNRSLVTDDGTSFTEMEIPDIPDGTRYNRLLRAVDGTVWVGTSNGVLRYVSQEWYYEVRAGNVTALAEAADGTVWAGCSPTDSITSTGQRAASATDTTIGIYRYQHRRWTHFGRAEGLPAETVLDLYGDNDGRVWALFGTDRGADQIWRFAHGRWRNVRRVIHPPGGGILTIAQTRDGSMWFGTVAHGVWQLRNGTWRTFRREHDLSTFTARALLAMPDGSLWAVGSPAGTIFRYADGVWTNYPVRDVGVAGRAITRMVYTLDDAFWFVIPGRGLARYDRRGGPWWIYDQTYGLPPAASVARIVPTGRNSAWVATTTGLERFDGEHFSPAPALRGLTDHQITALIAWPNGNIWAASGAPDARHGIWRFNGKSWTKVPSPAMLARWADITALHRTLSGDVWVGTQNAAGTGGYGLYRRSAGVHISPDAGWQRYGVRDGLPSDDILCITSDSLGDVWVGTPRGAARFDGKKWQTFGPENGLESPHVSTIFVATDGSVWMAGNVPYSGISRLRDGQWSHYTTDDGLGADDVWSIIEDESGVIWAGTARGVSRFDSTNGLWLTYRAGEGPAKDQVWGSALMHDGSLWFGHFDGAITRFHATSTEPPKTFLDPLPARVAYPGFVTVSWYGADKWERTRSKDLVYSWRLDGGRWSPFTRATSHLFTSLSSGRHVINVEAMDQEGNVDVSGAGEVITVEPPFWRAWWFLTPTIVGALGISLFGGIAYNRSRRLRHAQAQLVGELQRELQVAQRLQAELLPSADPVVPGLEITGLCRPASQVGGDYFTYLWVGEDPSRIGIAVADVTGHAMQAAIPAVLFSGMLATAARQSKSPGEILSVLNESLHLRTGTHTFICCVIAVFDLSAGTLYLANAGGLDPMRRRRGAVDSIGVSGERLPLGMLRNLRYEEVEIDLEDGDTYVFLTDGIVEAKDPAGEMFGFGRIEQVIGASDGPVDVRDRLLNAVAGHIGVLEQDDDITLLAVRITSNRQSPEDARTS